MLRSLAVTSVVTLLLLIASRPTAAQSVTLVDQGKAKATIYVVGPLEQADSTGRWNTRYPTTPEQYRNAAARELVYHLEKMSGATLQVVEVTDASKLPTPAIVLGEPAVKLGAKPTKTSESQEGFRLLVKDGRVLIGGESDKAVLHGVMELLRRLGCDWVMPGEIGECIPTAKNVVVSNLDAAAAPSYTSRRLWYRGYPDRKPEHFQRFDLWRVRMRDGQWSDMEGSPAGHVWDRFIRQHQAEVEADPTMLALRRDRDGNMVRMGPQLESTHPRVIELFVQDIKAAYEKNIAAGKWTKDTKAAFGVGPADGLGYSLSAESLLAGSGRMDPIVGEPDRTDELILLSNRILEAVTPEYPNAHVGFYSYSTHADYPARYKPHPNVVQIFAPINFSRFHSLFDDNSKTQAYYLDVVRQWGRLSREQGNVLQYRGYSWNLAENMLPYTKVKIWGKELPFYHEQGFRTLNVEGTKMWSVLAPSDYVYMRLAWDHTQDWKKLLADFCAAAYGRGAGPMEKYNHLLIDTQHGAGMEAGSYHAMHLIYDHDFVKQARALFKEAQGLAQTDKQKRRIEIAAIPIDFLELYLDYHDATRAFDFETAKAKYDAMMALWDKVYEQNNDLVAGEAPQYMKRFLARFVDAAVKYSTGEYEMVVKLPDQVKTMFDPNDVGHRMRYQSPDINDDSFITTRTFSTTWDAQGLTGMRDTTTWYRYHFALPDGAKGKPVGLFIGSVEDEARVWINGKKIGTSGRGFSLPFLFDLTDGIKYEGENVLAIQVIRNSKANEIGLGGIIRPCFIFTGPQLETAAPKPLNLGRVLPGGEMAPGDE